MLFGRNSALNIRLLHFPRRISQGRGEPGDRLMHIAHAPASSGALGFRPDTSGVLSVAGYRSTGNPASGPAGTTMCRMNRPDTERGCSGLAAVTPEFSEGPDRQAFGLRTHKRLYLNGEVFFPIQGVFGDFLTLRSMAPNRASEQGIRCPVET